MGFEKLTPAKRIHCRCKEGAACKMEASSNPRAEMDKAFGSSDGVIDPVKKSFTVELF
jgi:hypothetical protein